MGDHLKHRYAKNKKNLAWRFLLHPDLKALVYINVYMKAWLLALCYYVIQPTDRVGKIPVLQVMSMHVALNGICQNPAFLAFLIQSL